MINCKACGKEIAKGVKKCPHCGKDQRNFFMKHKILSGILILVLIGTIGSALGGGEEETGKIASNDTSQIAETTDKETEKVEEVKEEVIVVSAAELSKAYEENEVRADKDYKGKMVEVNGKVENIGVVLDQTYVTLSAEKDFSITSIQCFFKDESEIDKVSDLNEGDIITVKGKVDGKSMNVGVNDCIFK